MNHLAHLLVARRTGTSPAGALLADAMRHINADAYPAAFLRGVKLHHAVDDFTDAHPAVARSRARLGDGARHYRGVLVDVYYDHCLACSWAKHTDEPLRTFADATYRALSVELAQPAAPAAPWVRRMIDADWLIHFRRPEGTSEALRRMTGRLRRPRLLDGAREKLAAEHDGLQADFDAFFPELLAHVDAVAAATDGPAPGPVTPPTSRTVLVADRTDSAPTMEPAE